MVEFTLLMLYSKLILVGVYNHRYLRLRNRDRKLAHVIHSNQYQPPGQQQSLDFGRRGQKMATHRRHAKKDYNQTNVDFLLF